MTNTTPADIYADAVACAGEALMRGDLSIARQHAQTAAAFRDGMLTTPELLAGLEGLREAWRAAAA